MSFVKPVITDGGFAPRQLQIGDVLASADAIPATDTTNTNLTITAAMLLKKYIVRNPAGVSNENLDTALNLLAGFNTAAPSAGRLQDGISFIFRFINISVNALTVLAAANTGLILNRGAIAATSFKDFLVTVKSGTPAQTYSCVTTNASPVVGMTVAQAATLTPGMIVTNAVNGLQGFTILSVNIQLGAVTLSGSASATSTAPGVAISFSPVIQFDGLAP